MNSTNLYRERLTTLLTHARPDLATTHALAFKNVFGAVGGYVNGVIFVSSGSFGIALRLPPQALVDIFEDSDVAPLRYFPNGHVKRAYAVLPERILTDDRRFGELLDASIAHATLARPARPE